MRTRAVQISVSCMQCSKYGEVQQRSPKFTAADRIAACSLQCSKDHKDKCGVPRNALIDAAATETLYQESSDSEPVVGRAQQSVIDSITNAAEVQELFVRYPKLRTQLRGIYEASLKHDESEQHSCYQRESNTHHSRTRGYYKDDKQHWTPEKGIQAGLKKLHMCLRASDADFSGLKEFCKVITRFQPAGSQLHADEGKSPYMKPTVHKNSAYQKGLGSPSA
ncbi:hypothetical protein EPUS_06322 [Endocarpon pusillum Z07020]|uniref:Uncharacterized protein n=1 Tax=Endocarpon pusillum (strain Z07020 / HMAS-L-300199) TaxID=1263415 RepID=U1GEW8_ENDPU|nr:uncharacterized protein EPUS_06322 [Endocarpon pusillum Z07020]ERF70281.1 hypothetical protein EPUS_06322 [Endocarpon pusillum Z07020]